MTTRSLRRPGDIDRNHRNTQKQEPPVDPLVFSGATASNPLVSSQSTYRTAVTILFALIIYGSLYPLTWRFDHPKAFIYVGPVSVIDAVENILLFLPLGWLISWRCDACGRRWMHFWKWFLIVLVVASLLQWMQKYLPRTPAASDILFNIIGHLSGWWLGRLSALTLNSLVSRHHGLRNADRFALVLMAIWVFAELSPLIPSFDVSTVFAHIKSLWQQDIWQPRRIWTHIGMTLIGLEALAYLLRSASVDQYVKPAAILITLAMITGKFLVLGQFPGPAVPLGIASGALLWWLIDLALEETRLLAMLVISTGSYLLYALAPYAFHRSPTSMQWMPFASALRGNIESVMGSVAFEALCFGGMIWSSVRLRASPGLATLSVAFLAFGCEWMQRYIPGRTAEISSVVTALLVGWMVRVLSKPAATSDRQQLDAAHITNTRENA